MKIIESIEIKNYKSIIVEKIDFDDKTALVGANESGKSNIIYALNHLERNNQRKFFLPSDQNISIQHSHCDKIEITYQINLTNTVAPSLIKLIPELKDKLVSLTKSGKPNEQPSWSLCINKLPKFGNLVIISPSSKTKVLHTLKQHGYNEAWIDENIGPNYFIGGGKIRLSSNPFYKLIQLKQICIFQKDNKKKKLETIIRDEILKNIQIYFWKYDIDNYLKEWIPLNDYCTNWEKRNTLQLQGYLRLLKMKMLLSLI